VGQEHGTLGNVGRLTKMRRQAVNGLAIEPDGAVVCCLQASQAAQQSCLAAPGRPDDDQEFSIGDVEMNTIEGLDPAREGFCQVLDDEFGHGVWRCRRGV
jgi:hypothetical protein